MKVWREGIAPQLSNEGLAMLKEFLAKDDPRLLQGATTTPPPLKCVEDWPVEAACLLGVCCVADQGGFGTALVRNVEEQFARICFECDRLCGEPALCRYVLNWFDETPRDEMRRRLLAEVNFELSRRDADQPVLIER